MTQSVKISALNGQQPDRKRVAIIGFDQKTREQAPFDDPSVDIWGLNGGHLAERHDGRPLFCDESGGFRADAWFQIHPPSSLSTREQGWLAFAHQVRVPTLVREQDIPSLTHYWPTVEPYLRGFPLDAVRAAFPDGLFASTFCLEIALALRLGYEEILLFGIDSRDLGRELVVERPALTYWMGVGHTKGVKVTMPEDSTLGRHPFVYGMEYLEEAAYAASVTEDVLPRRLITQELTGNLNTAASVQAMATTLSEGA